VVSLKQSATAKSEDLEKLTLQQSKLDREYQATLKAKELAEQKKKELESKRRKLFCVFF
jgi:hypothetical protein